MTVDMEWMGEILKLDTGIGLFSPSGMDQGTRAMLAHAEFHLGDKVLDLGCGYGVVGLLAARKCGAENIWMTDIDDKAVRISAANAIANGLQDVHIVKSDGFHDLYEAGFQMILSNPPYHTDFSVAKHFIEKGFNRLTLGGKFVMVTKRLDWYKNKITAIFGGVKVFEERGYFVFVAEKRSVTYAGKAPKKTGNKTVKGGKR